MKLARVIGTVVATQKVESIRGLKIAMIQPLTDEMEEDGHELAAIDMTQSGPGELVWWILSREASLALPDPFAPVDACITGIVDDVYTDDQGIYNKEKIFVRRGHR